MLHAEEHGEVGVQFEHRDFAGRQQGRHPRLKVLRDRQYQRGFRLYFGEFLNFTCNECVGGEVYDAIIV